MSTFSSGMKTDVGMVRNANQDYVDGNDDLLVVADGMGGHNGGEVASELAVAEVLTSFESRSIDGLLQSVTAANSKVLERAEFDTSLRGMGTTLCAVARIADSESGDPAVGIVNVGDSRVYLFADDQLVQITEDHSLVAGLVRAGRLTPEEAVDHPQKNIVTRALGIEATVLIDAWEMPLVVGDRFVLCSDGLHGEISDDQIAAVLRRLSDPAEAADELVRQANQAGGHDNVTVAVVDIIDDPAIDTGETATIDERTVRVRRAATPAEDLPPGATLAAHLEPASVVEVSADRQRVVTWRSAVFLLLIASILIAGFISIAVIARSGFHVSAVDGRLAILRGEPDGLLWFDPTVEEETPLMVSDLRPDDQLKLDEPVSFDSIDEAWALVDEFAERAGLEPIAREEPLNP